MRRTWRLGRCIAFLAGVALSAPSVASADEHSRDLWLGTFMKSGLNEKLALWAEAQMRFDLDDGEMQQTLFRTGLLIQAAPHHSLGLLYGYIETGDKSEHRIALQHGMKYGSVGSASFSHRLRLEGRTFENIGFGAARLRYLLRIQGNPDKSIIPVVWNEAFINAKKNSRTGDVHFERNRIFVGARLPLDSGQAAEIGYLNQFVPRAGLRTF